MSTRFLLTVVLAAICISVTACVEAAVEPVEPDNRPPAAVGAISDRSVGVGGADTLDVAEYFNDPDGDALTYAVATADAGLVTGRVSGSTVILSGLAEGAATVTVTASDPSGSSARQDFDVTVLPFIASITVSPASDTIAPSDVEWLAATATGPDGDRVVSVDFKWSSTDPTVVRVLGGILQQGLRSDSVRIQGALDGTATITATGHGASGTSTITVENPDPASLAALHDATDGPNWHAKTNWLTESPISSWHGVEGNVYHRVVKLHLPDNGLSGRVPSELGRPRFTSPSRYSRASSPSRWLPAIPLCCACFSRPTAPRRTCRPCGPGSIFRTAHSAWSTYPETTFRFQWSFPRGRWKRRPTPRSTAPWCSQGWKLSSRSIRKERLIPIWV